MNNVAPVPYVPMTELMFHGLPDCTTQATFFGLCSKAGPVRKCMLQMPSHYYNNGVDGMDANCYGGMMSGSCNPRSRRVFGLVDYVHPGSVPLAKLMFQLTSYRDAGVLVSDAALSMTHKQHLGGGGHSAADPNMPPPASTRHMRAMESKENCFGYEVAVYHLHPLITEELLRAHFGAKGGLRKIHIVTMNDLLTCSLRAGLPQETITSQESAAILLFEDYMSAKIATCIEFPGLQLRLIGPLLRNRNASSSLYSDLDCYYRGRMITKNGPTVPANALAQQPALSNAQSSSNLFGAVALSGSMTPPSAPAILGPHPAFGNAGAPDTAYFNFSGGSQTFQTYTQPQANIQRGLLPIPGTEMQSEFVGLATSASISNMSVCQQGHYFDPSGHQSPVVLSGAASAAASFAAINTLSQNSETNHGETEPQVGGKPLRSNSMTFTSSMSVDLESRGGPISDKSNQENDPDLAHCITYLDPAQASPRSAASLDHLLSILDHKRGVATAARDAMLDPKLQRINSLPQGGRRVSGGEVMPNATRFVLGYLEDDPMWD